MNKIQIETSKQYVEIATGEGGKILCGGHALTEGDFSKGTFFEPTSRIGGYSYIDMSLSMPVATTGINLRIGVNNLGDKRPPTIPNGNYSECPNTSCNDNTFVGTYDTLGRYLYAHASVKF